MSNTIEKEHISGNGFEAINVSIEGNTCHIGILILEPVELDILELEEKFYIQLTNDLVNQKTMVVVTERSFEIWKPPSI